jgi:hypothetical protein
MPVDLGKTATGMRGAQALGFLEKGRHRVVVIHSLFLKLDFGLLPPAGGAELVEF